MDHLIRFYILDFKGGQGDEEKEFHYRDLGCGICVWFVYVESFWKNVGFFGNRKKDSSKISEDNLREYVEWTICEGF